VKRASVEVQRGETIIQKCLAVLVDFVYDKIAKKRLESINVMEQAIRTGINGGNFEEFINTYFDSRYTPLLRPYQYEYDISIVWDFIRLTNGDPDAVNHLRGACDRLLIENPDNGALHLLRAFARYLIPHYDKEQARLDFDRGLAIFRDQNKWNRDEYLSTLVCFVDAIIDHDASMRDLLGGILVAEHANWLRQFNVRFL
jgi:ATP-dependent DNA helicase RecQ